MIRNENTFIKMEKSMVYELIILAGVMGLTFWSTFHQNVEQIVEKEVAEPIHKTETLGGVSSPKQTKETSNGKQNTIPTVKNNVEKSPEINTGAVSSKVDSSLTLSTSLSNSLTVSLDSVTAGISNDTAEPIHEQNIMRELLPAERQLSKKELKEIKRAKDKAKRLRKEQEFLKGDQPYVVPIDPNRF
jgi:hypothetical protein